MTNSESEIRGISDLGIKRIRIWEFTQRNAPNVGPIRILRNAARRLVQC